MGTPAPASDTPTSASEARATGATQRDPAAREAGDDATAAGLQASIRAGPDAVCAARSSLRGGELRPQGQRQALDMREAGPHRARRRQGRAGPQMDERGRGHRHGGCCEQDCDQPPA